MTSNTHHAAEGWPVLMPMMSPSRVDAQQSLVEDRVVAQCLFRSDRGQKAHESNGGVNC